MCLVMIRALLVDNNSKNRNYTLQTFLIRHGREDLLKDIDNYLNQNINDLYTVRKIIKICVDKFIAHNETLTKNDENDEKEFKIESWFPRQLFLSDIKRHEYPFTISKIVEFIENILTKIPEVSEIEPSSIV